MTEAWAALEEAPRVPGEGARARARTQGIRHPSSDSDIDLIIAIAGRTQLLRRCKPRGRRLNEKQRANIMRSYLLNSRCRLLLRNKLIRGGVSLKTIEMLNDPKRVNYSGVQAQAHRKYGTQILNQDSASKFKVKSAADKVKEGCGECTEEKEHVLEEEEYTHFEVKDHGSAYDEEDNLNYLSSDDEVSNGNVEIEHKYDVNIMANDEPKGALNCNENSEERACRKVLGSFRTNKFGPERKTLTSWRCPSHLKGETLSLPRRLGKKKSGTMTRLANQMKDYLLKTQAPCHMHH
eukprot:CAMPEP_0184492190 /NCGR_PEP_ID=MMETSP0113_2-20130426/22547_1 /TAXON_ID=91329 /ORGANISM="Norrisiella sphaerica, Strain BC52" /LENGTH=292 /DNA_ID=CAMNT_0026876863 /DNA_START=281 /DNA_END=1159 /DNA_ORIENTATION=-